MRLVEVASNDGYLLRHAMERGVPVLGIEPTPGPAAAADREIGIPTTPDVLRDRDGGRPSHEYGPADVIVANNVMAHVPDLNGFVEGSARSSRTMGSSPSRTPTSATSSTTPSSTRSTTSTGATSRAARSTR